MNQQQQSNNKTKGFHWGWGITFAIILGASALIFLVYKSSQVEYDMVMENYYEEELDYEDMMQAQNRFEALSSDFKIIQTQDLIVLQFPQEMKGKTLEDAHLVMYRPSSKNEDLILPFQLDNQAEIKLNKSDFNEGAYIVKGNWYMDGVRYNLNKGVIINQ